MIMSYSMPRSFLLLVVGVLLISPMFVSAQLTGPLVPCHGAAGDKLTECQACHVVELGQKIINFLVAVAAVIAVVVFAYAGWLMLTAAGDMTKISSARGMFWNVLIGLVIVLAGWLIVDTVMKSVFQRTTDTDTKKGSPLYEATKDEFGPWNKIFCVTPVVSSASAPPATPSGSVVPVSTPVPSPGCPTCQAINTSIVPCNTPASCTIEAEYAKRLYTLAETEDVPKLRVTEACPPTRQHQNSCHYDCTCTDIRFDDRNFTTERIQEFAKEARAAQLRAVYEPGEGGVCPPGVECLPYSKTGSTGNHFSLYKI